MASDYRVSSVDFDVPLGSMTVLNPQPRSEGVKVTKRDITSSGIVIDQGLYCILLWPILKNAAAVQAIYTLFNLMTSPSALVTIYARDDTFTYRRYNGSAIRPQPSWTQFFPRNVAILVRDLEIAA